MDPATEDNIVAKAETLWMKKQTLDSSDLLIENALVSTN
jgi:hypothetical protein